MSQNDFSIANADGATVRADINGALQALATLSSGAAAPGTTYAGQIWWDTTNDLIKQRNGANTAWVTVASWDGTTYIPYRFGTALGTAAIADLLDEDAMTSNSATDAASQQSIKAYVDDNTSFPRGYIDGLTCSNNATDAAKDIDIAPGKARDGGDAATMTLAATLVKRLDASWAVGTNQGGLDGTESVAGTPDADTWYHCWLIRRSDTGVVDVLFSESATAPTMPTNYDQKRRVGAVLTDATPDIIAFIQHGDYFFWKSRVLELASVDAGITQTLLPITVPIGIKVMANIMGRGFKGTSAQYLLSSPQHDDNTPSTTDYDLKVLNYQASVEVFRETDTLGRIGYRASVASAALDILTLGWIDPRGRDA